MEQKGIANHGASLSFAAVTRASRLPKGKYFGVPKIILIVNV